VGDQLGKQLEPLGCQINGEKADSREVAPTSAATGERGGFGKATFLRSVTLLCDSRRKP